MLDSILTFGEDELVEGLKAFIEAIVNENVSLVISRQLLSEVHFVFLDALASLRPITLSE